MKIPELYCAEVVFLLFAAFSNVTAQEQGRDSGFDVNLDIYSGYIWRGTKFGQGASLQPTLKFTSGGLTVGAWGAFDASGYSETDPYLSFTFPFGLSLGLTDYYCPGLELFDISRNSGSQALELNGNLNKGGFSLSANYIFNKAGGIGSAGGDKYFEAGYTFKSFSVFTGAGDGWYTSDGEFAICNIGLGAARKVRLTDNFSFRINGQVIMNPEREKLYIVAGIGL